MMPAATQAMSLALRTGVVSAPQMRLGRGEYRASAIGNVVTLAASNITMSGFHPRAEFVHIPTFAPPLQYRLVVYETNPELDNYISGSAQCSFELTGDDMIVKVEDSDGVQDVPIARF